MLSQCILNGRLLYSLPLGDFCSTCRFCLVLTRWLEICVRKKVNYLKWFSQMSRGYLKNHCFNTIGSSSTRIFCGGKIPKICQKWLIFAIFLLRGESLWLGGKCPHAPLMPPLVLDLFNCTHYNAFCWI